jgi:hypothetical protein
MRSREWISYLSEDSMMAQRGIVHADQWRRAVSQASVGQTYGDRFFLAGVAVEVWMKQLAEHRAQALRAPAARDLGEAVPA